MLEAHDADAGQSTMIRTALGKSINAILRTLDLRLVRDSSFRALVERSSLQNDLALLDLVPPEHLGAALRVLRTTKSQLRQELFVLATLGFKRDGFFVEFGATDGVTLSNTNLLEKCYGWRGILAEPARRWQTTLRRNRHCRIETRCVWSTSDARVTFRETGAAELSTIEGYSGRDMHRGERRSGGTYVVETISLLDLLRKYDAPRAIDYLSIDTEGSEFDILKDFDFTTYQFRVITCEHNFTSTREKLHQLLAKNGYIRKYEELSSFDDWYVMAV
jgi:FkbM family methyltransferase